MNYDVLRQANAIIRSIPGNKETEITDDNVFDKRKETMQRVYDTYGIMPESKFFDCLNFVHNNHLIYLGHTIVERDGEKYLREIYVSNFGDAGNSQEFYEIFLQKESMLTGNAKFSVVDYDELIKTLSVPVIQDSTELPIALESVFDYDGVDDYEFATEADLTVNVTDKKPPGFGENNDQQQAGTGGEAEDITKTTAQAMGEDGGDTTDGGADTAGDMFDDNSGENDQGDDAQSPDIMDENEDDNDDDSDDEGTASKRRIRLNMVKLHNIIKDSLDAMNTFTPDYGIDVSRRYYKIRENLSTIDGILLRIINEQINDITVEELMKKYTTLCNIFDISVRAMRVFAEDYKSSLKKKH